MTRFALPLVALALFTSPTLFAASSPADEVEAVERARFQTWLQGDVATMRTVIADDALYCHSSGQCQTKAEFIADIEAKKLVYKKLDVVSMKAKALGSDAVIINGTVDVLAEAPGKVAKFKGIYTSVYVKRQGRWQLISWQSTSLP